MLAVKSESVPHEAPQVESETGFGGRFRSACKWLLIWGIVGAGAAVLYAGVPWRGQAASGGLLLRACCWLGVGIGFGGLAYATAVFAFFRTVRHLLFMCAFAALVTGGAVQAICNSTDAARGLDDRIFLVAWFFAAVAFAGGAHSTSAMRRGRVLRSIVQLAAAGFAAVAFPVILTIYAFSPALYSKLHTFPTELWAPHADSALALASAGLLAVAVGGQIRLSAPSRQRLDRVLYGFLGMCLVALIGRAEAPVIGGSIWFAGWFLASSAWLVLAAGFSGESAVTHKELAERVEDAEALHEVSWSLVGTRSDDNFVRLFANTVREKLDAEIVAVYLTDPDHRSLDLAALSGDGEGLASPGTTYIIDSDSPRPGFHSGHTADAFRSGQMRTADDVFVDIEFVPWRTVAKGDGRALSLPLIDQQETFGVLNVYFRDRRQAGPQRVAMLRTLAAAAGPTLAGLWTEMHSQRTQQDRLGLAA